MPGITKTDLFVFRPWIRDQNVHGLEINRFGVVKHSPNALAVQDLIALVVVLVQMF
jgi:hypothetical protein